MGLKIGTIEYIVGDENFEVEVNNTKVTYHQETGGYKEPNDDIETVEFTVETEHGTITGQASARRSGFDTYYEYEENIELSIDNDDESIEILAPECTVEDDDLE